MKRPLLRLWDGGAFQRLLPQLLLNEPVYSSALASTSRNYSDYLIAEGRRLGTPGLSFHSASRYGYDNNGAFTQVPAYEGKAGSPDLVSTDHVDINNPKQRALWNQVMTPHAAFLAATNDPNGYATIIANMKTLRSGSNLMYRPGSSDNVSPSATK